MKPNQCINMKPNEALKQNIMHKHENQAMHKHDSVVIYSTLCICLCAIETTEVSNHVYKMLNF